MRDVIRIEITSGYITISHEAMETAAGDPVVAAQNELGFTGLVVADAEVNDYLEDETPGCDDDDISLDAHPELSDEDAL